MKAIETRYLSAAGKKGARIRADDGDGNRAVVPYPYSGSGPKAHFRAVEALCRKMGWTGALIAGATDRGYVFVWADSPTFTASPATES